MESRKTRAIDAIDSKPTMQSTRRTEIGLTELLNAPARYFFRKDSHRADRTRGKEEEYEVHTPELTRQTQTTNQNCSKLLPMRYLFPKISYRNDRTLQSKENATNSLQALGVLKTNTKSTPIT